MYPQKPRFVAVWACIGLVMLLLFDVWWRGHTMGPAVAERLGGVQLWPVVRGESEPLDCDEAAYAYMGRRMAEGAVLYKDLAENKPPVGYWLYELAVFLGGPTEWTIRWMPVPIVLVTLVLIWWIGWQLAGPIAACLSLFLYVLLSTDPYLYGNGAQIELPLNLFGVASLACILHGWKRGSLISLFLAGVCVSAGALTRQVAVLPLLVYTLALLVPGPLAKTPRRFSTLAREIFVLWAGFVVLGLIILAWIWRNGVFGAMVENVILGGAALVSDTRPPSNAPPAWMRWLTGNSDPATGAVPWPFGRTNYLVWWGCGSWPLWLAGVLALVFALRGDFTRRLIAVWTLSACMQVVLPQQYWAHYYLLPTPGVALLVAILASDLCSAAKNNLGVTTWSWFVWRSVLLIGLTVAIGATTYLQVRDYLLVPSEQLAIRYKGGAQWVRLRQIGRELAGRTEVLSNKFLLVWGWQSPLYFYSGLDSPSRHFFTNDLLKTQATGNHSLVSRWIAEIVKDIDRYNPGLIFTGYPPFPALEQRLKSRYQTSRVVPEAPALWVLKSEAVQFEKAGLKRGSVAR